MQIEFEPFPGGYQVFQEFTAVFIVPVNGLTPIASAGDMIKAAFSL